LGKADKLDPALEVPLPIDAIIHAAKADDAVQRALIAKGNPVLEAHVARHREEAKAEGSQKARPRRCSRYWPHGGSRSEIPSVCGSSGSGIRNSSTAGSQGP
jgi:hypothetical protein